MLELREVSAGYGSVGVLDRVSIAVPVGSIVALLGPNGAGKTTTLRVASGLLPVGTGSVHFAGEDITQTPPHERACRGLALVPEGRGIFPRLTVRDNLVIQARGRDREAAFKAASDAFPILGQRLDQLAGTLSGGEQQMLALAKTFVTRPQVALLDEVSFGLAPIIVDQIFEFLQRLASEGTALLIVEQYAEKALRIADFVYLLRQGKSSPGAEPSEVDLDTLHAAYLEAETPA